MTIWDEMCQRRVRDKEVSNEGLYKTSYDLHMDSGNIKREQQKIKFIDQNKQVKTTILKQLKASENITLTSSNNDVLQKTLSQTFRNDKDSIAQYIRECLQYQFSRNTKKVLRRFATRLFSCSNSQAKFFLRKLALCIWSIRVWAQKFETKHNMSVMQMTTSEKQSGMLPFARGVLT